MGELKIHLTIVVALTTVLLIVSGATWLVIWIADAFGWKAYLPMWSTIAFAVAYWWLYKKLKNC